LYATDLEHGTFDPTDKLLEGLRGKLGIESQTIIQNSRRQNA